MITEAEQVADDMFRYPFQLAFAGAFGDAGLWASGQRVARDLGHDSPGRGAFLARSRTAWCASRDRSCRRCRSRGGQRATRGCVRRACATAEAVRLSSRFPGRAGTESRRSGSSSGRSSRLPWPWPSPGRPDGTRTARQQKSGQPWPAGWAAGCSRLCATAGLWPTPSWPRAGSEAGRARWSPISRLPPSGRTRPARQCWRSWTGSPVSRSVRPN